MDERLLGRVKSPEYDPAGRSYLGGERDPFLYRITRVMRVYNRYSGEIYGYEMWGLPTGLRTDWEERMWRQEETRFARVLEPTHDMASRYLNSEDTSDPYLYEISRVMRHQLWGRVWYEFWGFPVGLRPEWERAFPATGRDEAWDAYQAKQQAHGRAREQAWERGQQNARHSQGGYRPPRRGEQPLVELYAVLGVRVGASKVEIKQAYRRLARECHPDVSKAPDAHERFVVVTAAYERLVVVAPD